MTCTCGHVEDEHSRSFFQGCEVDECGCEAYDGNGEDDDE